MTARTVAQIYILEYVSGGAQIESYIMEELFNLLGSRRIRTIAYHRQDNGILDRFNRSLREGLAVPGDFFV